VEIAGKLKERFSNTIRLKTNEEKKLVGVFYQTERKRPKGGTRRGAC